MYAALVVAGFALLLVGARLLLGGATAVAAQFGISSAPSRRMGLRPLDLIALVVSAVLVLTMMRRGWVLSRWEGAPLIAGYVAYLYSVVS